MSLTPHTHLSRRESQIMDILFRLNEASVAEVLQRMPEGTSYDSVRVTLGILKKKGYVRNWRDGKRYIYAPATSPAKAERSALHHVLKTFFPGAPSRAIVTLIDLSAGRLSDEELDAIAESVQKARQSDRP